MSVFIPGMDMPKKDEILVFDEWHDKVYARSTANTGTRRYEIVPLPEGHGRLIDADALISSLDGIAQIERNNSAAPYSWSYAYMEMQTILDDAPTIVPAEGGGEDG